MARTKITVVGAGNVGATCAQRLAERDYADVAIVDVVEGLAAGKGLDLLESGPVESYDTHVTGSTDYGIMDGSDIVVVTAGAARKPGMSRDDLLGINQKIVGSIALEIKNRAPDSFVIVVTNPLDAMAYLVKHVTGFPANRVVGMAGLLDNARYRSFIAEKLGVSVKDVASTLLGGHGDTMVPLPRLTTVGGVPITELLPADEIEALVDRTRKGGGEIVALLGTGSAFYAPSAAAAEMVDAIALDKKRVVPCAAYLNGEYGHKDIYLGVPIILGGDGVERILECKLTDDEKAMLQKSAADVHSLIEKMAL